MWVTCADIPWAMAPPPPVASAPVSVIFIMCFSHKEMLTDTEHTLSEERSPAPVRLGSAAATNAPHVHHSPSW